MWGFFLLISVVLANDFSGCGRNSCTKGCKVCLEGQNELGFVCFGLAVPKENNNIGKVCIRLITPTGESCSRCSSCPCTAFQVVTHLYDENAWYLKDAHLWLGRKVFPNITYPYSCQVTPCCGKECVMEIPFKDVFGSYNISNLCGCPILFSEYANVFFRQDQEYLNATAWIEGYILPSGNGSYNYLVPRCGNNCPVPVPTPTPVPVPVPVPTPTPMPPSGACYTGTSFNDLSSFNCSAYPNTTIFTWDLTFYTGPFNAFLPLQAEIINTTSEGCAGPTFGISSFSGNGTVYNYSLFAPFGFVFNQVNITVYDGLTNDTLLTQELSGMNTVMFENSFVLPNHPVGTPIRIVTSYLFCENAPTPTPVPVPVPAPTPPLGACYPATSFNPFASFNCSAYPNTTISAWDLVLYTGPSFQQLPAQVNIINTTGGNCSGPDVGFGKFSGVNTFYSYALFAPSGFVFNQVNVSVYDQVTNALLLTQQFSGMDTELYDNSFVLPNHPVGTPIRIVTSYLFCENAPTPVPVFNRISKHAINRRQ